MGRAEPALRERRIPVYVSVTAQPALRNCWSLNISSAGMGLFGEAEPETAPRAGSILYIEFGLPGGNSRLLARGRVQWVKPSTRRDGQLALGVEFIELQPEGVAAIRRYVAEDRPHVLVALAGQGDISVCTEVLTHWADVHVARSPADLREALNRGDLSAVLVFRTNVGDAQEAFDAVAGPPGPASPSGSAPWAVPWADVPRLLYCAPSDDPLCKDERIFQLLVRPLDSTALTLALKRAFESWSVNAELRRVRDELDRALQREASRRPRGPATDVADGSNVAGALQKAFLEWDGLIAVRRLVERVAPHDVHVLLQGETGTGKERLARAIHDLSSRPRGPFVTVDCSALAETLLETELFGHIKGAFTGAVSDHRGLFDIADGGTLFVDEVQSMTPAVQAKLLRAIEVGEVRAVGESRSHHVDVRVVAATNEDLRSLTLQGRFRADLFFRLNVFAIQLPPLCDRQSDILALAEGFAQETSEKLGCPPPPLSSAARIALLAYGWPGNVRELKNAIESAVLLTPPGTTIDTDALPRYLTTGTDDAANRGSRSGRGLRGAVRDFEARQIQQALDHAEGVLADAAKILRINPVTLGRRARQYGLWPWSTKGGRGSEPGELDNQASSLAKRGQERNSL